MYILFVSAGGVFVAWLLAWAFASLDKIRLNAETRREISKMYSDKNLAKMEYDLAFYDGDLYSRRTRSESAKQVTIEDVFNGGDEEQEEEDELSRFYPIAEAHDKTAVGHYDPESAND